MWVVIWSWLLKYPEHFGGPPPWERWTLGPPFSELREGILIIFDFLKSLWSEVFPRKDFFSSGHLAASIRSSEVKNSRFCDAVWPRGWSGWKRPTITLSSQKCSLWIGLWFWIVIPHSFSLYLSLRILSGSRSGSREPLGSHSIWLWKLGFLVATMCRTTPHYS